MGPKFFSRRVAPLVLVATFGVTVSAWAQPSAQGTLLVLLRDSSQLAIVDPTTGETLAKVPTGRDPHEVTASDDGRLAFVASMVDGISVIDLETREEVRRVDPGPGSETHDLLYLDGKVYFTIEGYKSIGRYDPTEDTIDWTIGIGEEGVHMLVHDPRTGNLFTPNTGSNTVTMIENATSGPAEARTIHIDIPGETPEALDLSPDGSELWTATRADGGVSVIDVARREVVADMDLGMIDANRLRFTPDGRVLIIDGEAAQLLVMDSRSREVVERVSLGEVDTGDGALLVGPDGRYAYAGLRAIDKVAIVNLETLEVTMELSFSAGDGPGCMYWVRPS